MENFTTSLSALKERKGTLIALIAVILVPLVYAMIILTASWGPYDNLSNLPVAVVNDDVGAMSGGERINAGEDLVKTLKESKSLGFEFVSAKEAQQGIEDMSYYMVIEIPADFSEKITTVLDAEPKVPEINITQNEGLHFMAAQVTGKAADQIREQLGNKITETYVKNMFSQLEQVAAGFKDGADGSRKLNEGSVKLRDGTGQILGSLEEKSGDITKLAEGSTKLKAGTGELLGNIQGGTSGVNKLADGSKKVADGVGTAYQGAKELSKGAKDLDQGITQVDDGAKKIGSGAVAVNEGATALNKGATGLHEGAQGLKAGTGQVLGGLKSLQASVDGKLAPGSRELAKGMNEANSKISGLLEPGAHQVADGIEQLAKHPLLGPILAADKDFQRLRQGSKDLAAGMTLLKDGAGKLSAGANELAAGIDKEGATTPTLSSGIQQLVAGQTAVDTGMGTLLKGSEALQKGSSDLAAGTNTLSRGASDLANGTDRLAAGSSQLAAGNSKLASRLPELVSGASQVADGNGSLKGSWTKLTDGARQIDNGMLQVSEGNQSVATGWGTLTDGVRQVDGGVGQIEDGTKELQTGLEGGAEKVGGIKANDENIAQFAAPVELKKNVLNRYPMYRYANAPYILALALFVGVLIMTVLFQIRQPEDSMVSGISWYGNVFARMAGVAVLQALAMSIFVLFFLELTVYHSILLVLFSVIASLSFLAIVFFLVAAAGNIGRLLALAFLVLQLSTTGSSLPVDMLPSGLRALSHFLPMTYAIESFRSIISLNNAGEGWANIMVLCIFLIIGLALTAAVAIVKSRGIDSSRTIET
ncbi:YhgE/Pip domain-containing protein [Bacillus sp. REN3]|uniref:YhgE/Pip domain-containing protein n=1 Tax=Bacillus sp. REN3 TaxID=2802440 RepID=UPI001AEDE5B1|nr:YhgE/Pip domain-containing protein [Bacillus sp. REN3]